MGNPEIVKVDCHVHSCFSNDSILPVPVINEERQWQGLDWVAITDHNTIPEIARDLKEKSGRPFILGEEILTSEKNSSGKRIELIGLFIQKPIEPGFPIIETVHQINDQGGIVVIPHPFEEWRHGAGGKTASDIVDSCSKQNIPVAIEVFNARARSSSNRRAEDLHRRLRNEGFPVLMTAGSDAHRMPEIGRGYICIPPFENNKEEFVEALKQARIYGEVNALGTLYHRLLNRIEMAMNFSLLDLQAIFAWERRGRRGY